MSRHPSEPPADWLPSPEEGPAPREALPQRPVPPLPRPGYLGADSQPGNGHGTGDQRHTPGHPSMPGHPPMPGHSSGPRTPAIPDHPSMPGHSSGPRTPAMPGYPSMPDYPLAADYPPAPDYPGYPGYQDYSGPPGEPRATAPGEYPPNGHQPAAGPRATDGPAIAHDGMAHDEYGLAHDEYGLAHEGYGVAHDEYGAAHEGYGVVPGEYGLALDDYGLAHEPAAETLREVRALPQPAHAAPADVSPADVGPADVGPAEMAPDSVAALRSGDTAARLAMLAYLTVPLFGFVVPLAVYLRARHTSSWTRAHAAQALNVWITAVIYGISAVIMGTMLALDSPQIALIVFGPLVAGLWLVTLAFLVRAATAASEGMGYTFPRWLCSPIVR